MKKLIMILTLTMVLALPLGLANPSSIASIMNPIELDYNEIIFFDGNDFFTNYQGLSMDWFHVEENEWRSTDVIFKGSGQVASVFESDYIVEAYSFGNDIAFLVESRQADVTLDPFYVYAWSSDMQSHDFQQTKVEITGTQAPPPNNPPTNKNNIPNVNLDYNDQNYMLFNDYFNNYQEIEVSFSDPETQTSVLMIAEKGGSSDSYQPAHIKMFLDSYSNNIGLDIQSVETDITNLDIMVKAINSDGDIAQTFTLNVEESEAPPPSGGESSLDGAVAYYTFDENTGTVAGDSVGSNDGTLVNSPSWVNGKIGSGLDFGTKAQQRRVDANLPAFDNNYITYSLWFKTTETDWIGLLGRDGSASHPNLYLNQVATNRIVISSDTNAGIAYIDAPDATDGEWKHIVVTRDGPGDSFAFYYNGNLVSHTLEDATSYGSTSANLNIGARKPSTTIYMSGLIDEVAIFDKALNSDEVEFLFAQGNPDSEQQYPFEGQEEPEPEPENPPTSLTSFPNPLVLSYNEQIDYNMNQFFNDYTEIQVNMLDPIASETINLIRSKGGTTITYDEPHLTFSLTPISNTIILNMIAKETEFETQEVTITASNEHGSISKTFDFRIDEEESTFENKPLLLASVAGANLEYNTFYDIKYSDIFMNFNAVQLIINDDSETFIIGEFEEEDSEKFFTSVETSIGIVTLMKPKEGNIGQFGGDPFASDSNQNSQVWIETNEEDGQINMIMRTQNEFGSTNSNTFTITNSQAGSTPPIQDDGIISGLVNQLSGLFPDKDTLSQTQRWGYVLITMLVVSLLPLLLVNNLSNFTQLFYIILTLDVLLFAYFLSIGYIPVSLLVIMLLGGLAISYFKLFRGGSSTS